eukprot:10707229-Ditylum_brightwellii.AAC.1
MAITTASISNTYSFTELKFSLNKNTSVYQHGKMHGVQKHIEVMHVYLHLKDQAYKNSILMQQLAKETTVGGTFVCK